MKKVVKLTESDLIRIVQQVINESKEDIDEGLFDGVKDVMAGIKGFVRGEGYDYYKYLSSLDNIIGSLKNVGKSNLMNNQTQLELIKKLTNLREKINNSTLNPERVSKLIGRIDKVITSFNTYSTTINKVADGITTELKLNR